MAAWLYEGFLLFAVALIASLVFSVAVDMRSGMDARRWLLQGFLLVVFAVYFSYLWTRGQTLAMKTWHIRLQARDGGVPSQARAFVRYVASWLWFVPALASAHFSGIHSTLAFAVIVAAGMLAYALLARLRGDRQFLHDALCGTQLVDSREIQPAPAQSVS